tara:strand:+ start:11767 stop:12834 length:1068 start_codon:yes stop_codon:yes gene_type:complete
MSTDHNRARLRVGVVGAGFISQVAHLHSFASLPDAKVVALCDPRPTLARDVAKINAITQVYANADDMFASSEVDAFVICVHRRCLPPLVERALKTGKPVLSEKPMAYSVAQAQRLVDVCSPGQPYAVGVMKRFDVGVRHFRELLRHNLATQSLGAIIHVDIADFCPTYGVVPPPHIRSDEPKSYRYEEWPRVPEGLAAQYADDYEYMLNVGSHDINLIRWLLPETLTPQSLFVQSGRAQHAILSAQGFDVSLRLGRSDAGFWDQSITIYFERGRMVLTLPSPLDRSGIATVQTIMHEGSVSASIAQNDGQWAFVAQAVHFCAAARGEVLLESAGSDSLRDIELIEALWARVVWRQ